LIWDDFYAIIQAELTVHYLGGFMNIHSNHSNTSMYSGKVLVSAIMLVLVFIVLAIFMAYGIRASAVSKYDKAEAEMAALNSAKAIKEKPLVGVVKGIMLNPPRSSAVVDETIVHAGDVIHEITVVGISDNKVEFAKDGNSWQQGVLDAPHAAWPNPVKVTKLPGK
jgi:hypothetical protein